MACSHLPPSELGAHILLGPKAYDVNCFGWLASDTYMLRKLLQLNVHRQICLALGVRIDSAQPYLAAGSASCDIPPANLL